MTASMYILLLLALIFANAPFITTKFFGIIALKRKHIGHHLIELLAGFLLTAILAYILESRAGAVHAQDWEFYATGCLPLPDFCLSMLCMALLLE